MLQKFESLQNLSVKCCTAASTHFTSPSGSCPQQSPIFCHQLLSSSTGAIWGFLLSSRTNWQQLLREQGALFISFLNPNWQPFSHYPTSRLPRSDLIFFINTFHFELCSTPLQQLGVNCHFQGHLAKSCSFVMKRSDCAFDTITVLLDCSKHNKKTSIY